MMMMISTCVVSLTNPPPLPVFSHSHNKKNKNIIISSSSAATPTTHFGLGAAYPFDKRTKGQTFRVFASSSRSRSGDGSSSRMVMVDPLEAKRLAAVQMEEIQAREKFKRQRRIEAINGAWAMIGLTAGLVIEGQTGKSILDQLADYWSSVGNFFPIDAFSWGRLKQVCEDLQVTCWFIE